MMITADFERAVRAVALAYDGPKEGAADGLIFWKRLERRRPDLTCRCHTCRSDPWQHVKWVLRDCGFSDSATS